MEERLQYYPNNNTTHFLQASVFSTKNYKAKLKRQMAEYIDERILEVRSKIEKSGEYKYGQRYTKTGIKLYFVI